MYQFVVIDDDRDFALLVEKELKAYVECEVQVFFDLKSIMTYMKSINNAPDMIFSDIHLEDISTSYMKKIKAKFPNSKLVFFSGLADLSVDIFEANPTYFLPKPLDINKLHKIIDTYLIKVDEPTYLTFQSHGQPIRVDIDKILYLYSDKRILNIVTNKDTISVYAKLDDVAKDLPSSFLKGHQSYMVNLKYVTSISSTDFILKNNDTVPISKAKYKEAKQAFIAYLGKNI